MKQKLLQTRWKTDVTTFTNTGLLMRPECSGSLAEAHHQPSLPRHPLFSLPSLRLSPKAAKTSPENDPGCGSPGYSFHNPIIQCYRLLALAFSKSANSLSINHCHELHCIHVLWGWIEVCFCHIFVSDSSDRRDFVTESVSSPDTLDTPDTPWVCPPPD